MAESKSLEDVSQLLRTYADRGVFRSFDANVRGQHAEYQFVWLFGKHFTVRVHAASRTVRFADLLPGVPYPSNMDRELRAFVRGRTSRKLPQHRRIDQELAQVKCSNRRGTVSIQLDVKGDQLVSATRRAVNLVNEIFHSFLSGPYHEYLVTQFDAPEE